MPRQKQPIDQRFWTKVTKTPGCWEYRGARTADGYGVFQMGRGTGTRKAHIVAWELVRGSRKDLWVLHHCDNPPCCRPDHLYLGTQEDNARDMSRRGRSRGSKVTHCPQGHMYDEKNTRYDQGRRRCRTCLRT